jgi:hypothetical protein
MSTKKEERGKKRRKCDIKRKNKCKYGRIKAKMARYESKNKLS